MLVDEYGVAFRNLDCDAGGGCRNGRTTARSTAAIAVPLAAAIGVIVRFGMKQYLVSSVDAIK
jgi:hypothetical protein